MPQMESRDEQMGRVNEWREERRVQQKRRALVIVVVLCILGFLGVIWTLDYVTTTLPKKRQIAAKEAVEAEQLAIDRAALALLPTRIRKGIEAELTWAGPVARYRATQRIPIQRGRGILAGIGAEIDRTLEAGMCWGEIQWEIAGRWGVDISVVHACVRERIREERKLKAERERRRK